MYYEDDQCLVIYDGYPKSRYHLLLLPKPKVSELICTPIVSPLGRAMTPSSFSTCASAAPPEGSMWCGAPIPLRPGSVLLPPPRYSAEGSLDGSVKKCVRVSQSSFPPVFRLLRAAAPPPWLFSSRLLVVGHLFTSQFTRPLLANCALTKRVQQRPAP